MNKELQEILAAAKDVAVRFKNLTGKPLGITGEIAEFSAAKLLALELAEARQAGYDAIDSSGRKIQIKGRCLPESQGPGNDSDQFVSIMNGIVSFWFCWTKVLRS